jgi:GNAT superfamily N-acetyltransferase
MVDAKESTLAKQGPSPETVNQIIELVGKIPHFYDPEEPILGLRDEDIVAHNLSSLLQSPDTTVVTAEEQGKVTGFSLAVSLGRFDPSRNNETDAAYLYYIATDPSHRGEGIGRKLTDNLFQELREEGYNTVEVDAVISKDYAESYAAQLQKWFGHTAAFEFDHEAWEEAGPERFFQIDLTKLSQ